MVTDGVTEFVSADVDTLFAEDDLEYLAAMPTEAPRARSATDGPPWPMPIATL